MKRLYQTLALFLIVVASSCSTSKYYQGNPDDYYQNDQQSSITYQQFYNDLSPYGNWMNYGNYGYVWRPNQMNFRPYYTNGQWAYTDYGWTWVSNYNWGWAPFHYGRWINDMAYGWMWVPGYEWAPAWVTWRGGGDYYGWAPLAPGMNGDYYGGSLPYNYWTFVPGRYMTSPRINNYYVNPRRNAMMINNTTIINNTVINQNNSRPSYNPGPPVREVERSTGAPIRKFNVVEASRPEAARVNNNTIRVFRPSVNRQASNQANVRPQKVTDINEVRRTTNQPEESNMNEERNARPAPVREFPKDQTPQINRNEHPANSTPSVQNRNVTPAQVSPQRNNERPVQQSQPNRNVQPEKQNNQEAPVRNFNRNQLPANTPSVEQNQIQNNRPAERPVRQMPVNTTPPAAAEQQPVRQREIQTRPNTPANNVRQNPPTRRLNTPAPAATQRDVNEKQEIREVRPAQNVRRIDQDKNQEKR